MDSLKDVSVEELDALLAVEQANLDALKDKVRVLKKARDVAFEKREVVRKITGLNPAGLAALAQIVGPEGMESLTKFGVIAPKKEEPKSE